MIVGGDGLDDPVVLPELAGDGGAEGVEGGSALGAAFGPVVLFRVARHRVGANAALAVMAAGFATTVVFYTFGAMPPTDSILSVAAHLPGDPFERVVPWLPGVAILLLAGLRRKQDAVA